MSGGKMMFTFITGVASGLALAYYADPKGSQRKLKQIEKELKKNRKVVDKKLAEYKGYYNGLVEKYANTSKDLIENAKGFVDDAKKTAKTSNTK